MIRMKIKYYIKLHLKIFPKKYVQMLLPFHIKDE